MSSVINKDHLTYATELLKAIDNEVPAENKDIDGETEDYHNLLDRIANVPNVINLDTM